MRRLFFITFTITGLCTWLVFQGEPTSSVPPPNNPKTPVATGSVRTTTSEEILKTKVQRFPGWSITLADTVASVLAPGADQILGDPTVMRQLEHLQITGNAPALIQEYPSTVALLLMADASRRQEITDGILSVPPGADRDILVSSCVKYRSPLDIAFWAQALRLNGTKIATLLKAVPTWPVDAVFSYDRAALGQECSTTYDKWVIDALNVPFDEQASMLQFLIESGPMIRKRLKSDTNFRLTLLSHQWPNFKSCVKDTQDELNCGAAWHCFADAPLLWDLVALPEGRELFKHSGTLAAELLCGAEAPATELKSKYEQVLLIDSLEVKESLERDGKNPQFQQLVAGKHLSDADIISACGKLNIASKKSDQERQHLLADWNATSNPEELHEKIGPPDPEWMKHIIGYSLLRAATKQFKGRTITGEEVALAAKDAWDLYTLGQSKTVEDAAEKWLEQTAKSLAEAAAINTLAPRHESTNSLSLQYRRQAALRLQPDDVKNKLRIGNTFDISSITKSANLLTSRSNGSSSYVTQDDVQFKAAPQRDPAGYFRIYANIREGEKKVNSYESIVCHCAQQLDADPTDKKIWHQNLAFWWLCASKHN